MGQFRRKNPAELLIRVSVQLSADDIAYLDKNYSNRSQAVRQCIREKASQNGIVSRENMERTYKIFKPTFDDIFDDVIEGRQSLDTAVAPFVGMYDRVFDQRPSNDQVKAYLMDELKSYRKFVNK